MGLPERAASFLDIHPGEGRSASLMMAHSFSMGLSTVFFETAASALFLAHFGSSLLPWVYIVAAVVNTVTGVVYSTIQDRVPFRRLMTGTITFLLMSVCAFRLGIGLTTAAGMLFGLLVWYRVVSILTDLEYWAVAGRLYDVRQAKRLFGLIGSGEVVARIVGAFSVPLLVDLIGVHNLLVLSAAGLASCLVLLLATLAAPAEAVPPPARGRSSRRPATGALRSFQQLLENRFLLLLFLLALLGVLGKYFVDYAFLAQMKSRYGDAKGLATFFGVFSGVSQVLSLLTRLLLSGRLLSRYGIRVGLVVLPLTHVLCTGLVVLAGMLLPASGAVFWLVIANQGVYKTLKHPVDNPSFKVLYQPLRKEQRLAAQIAVETIVTPITTGLAGAVMLLFTVVVPYDPVIFSLVMLLTFGAWASVALRSGREYSVALLQALKKRIVDDGPFSFGDDRSIAVLKEALASDRPEDVLFALELLEKSQHERIGSILVDLLEHPSAEVRRVVLLQIERVRPASALDPIRRRVQLEESPPVRAAALRSLCAVGGPDVVKQVSPYLEHPEAEVRRGATIGLLRAGGTDGAGLAREHLLRLASSAATEDRIAAAQIIGEVGGRDATDVLARSLKDEVSHVRRAALAAAARVNTPELWPLVIESLFDRAVSGAGAAALVSAGEGLLPQLAAAFDAADSPPIRRRIARIWARIGGARAIALLRERIGFPDESVRDDVLESLRLCGYRAAGAETSATEERIREEARDSVSQLAVGRDLGQKDAFQLLRSALAGEVERSRQRIFLLLSFLYDPTAIQRARDNLAHESREKRAYALEVLDVTLSAELREILLPLCEDLTPAERCLKLDAHFPQVEAAPHDRIQELLTRPYEWVTPWTRACAVHTVGILRAADLRPAVASLLEAERTPLVRETAAWTLARLGGGKGGPPAEAEGATPMLTIEKVLILKAVQMFATTSEEMLADVAAILEEVEVEAGEVIFEKGDAGDSMYVVVEGRVKVYDGERTIVTLGEREIFGELALLDPEPRFASIAALVDTRLFRLDREAFSELMAGNIEMVRGVLHVLCERLRRQAAEPRPYRDAPVSE